jgi:hypothetical protein
MVTRDQMIAYLLHQMPEEERDAFAERWFTEPELYERLQILEAELLDDWASGKVSPTERHLIERYLSGSQSQRRKMAFATALHNAMPRPRVRRVPWMAMVAALLVASLGLSLWLGLQNRRLENEMAQLHQIPLPSSDAVYKIGLPRDVLRGGSPENSVRLPAGVRLLRLELELAPGDEKNVYSATLEARNRTLWNEGLLHPEVQGSVTSAMIWIPADLLRPGGYAVRLDAPDQPPAYYRFTIIR